MIRSLFVLAIVVVLCIQSLLSYLLFFSLDQPEKLGWVNTQSTSKINNVRQQMREQLSSLLDFGPNSAPKKQTTPTQIAVTFNLFVQTMAIELPDCTFFDLHTQTVFTYELGYFYTYTDEILHPPQYI